MFGTIRRGLKHDQGNELIEFALVAPLLVLLLAGGAEFGRAFYTYHILTKSVRTAARYLSASQISTSGMLSDGAAPNNYVTKAKRLAVFGNTAGTGSKVLPDLGEGDFDIPLATDPGPDGQYYLTVTAHYTYTPLFDFVLPSLTFQPKETMVFVGTMVGG